MLGKVRRGRAAFACALVAVMVAAPQAAQGSFVAEGTAKFRYKGNARAIKVTQFAVAAPAGTLIGVSCQKRKCKRGSITAAGERRFVSLKPIVHKRFRRGAGWTVEFSEPGMYARVRKYTVTRKGYRIRERCRQPGLLTLIECPAATGDMDVDGVANRHDACPFEAGPQPHGCPGAQPTEPVPATSEPTGPISDTKAPSAPSGLQVTGVAQTELTLSWTASTDDVRVAGYDTFRGATKIASTAGTSYKFTGLGCSQTHTFGVVAFDAAGNRSAQASKQASTAACPAAPQPPQTWAEQQGSLGANTFTNPYNASGQGQKIAAYQWVDVSCKVYAPQIQSANPDGYWYRIATAPWNNQYYAVANTFWNGDVPGQKPYTHFTDWAVRDC
jgi:hypothetical protein